MIESLKETNGRSRKLETTLAQKLKTCDYYINIAHDNEKSLFVAKLISLEDLVVCEAEARSPEVALYFLMCELDKKENVS
jgi:hypothetical protein